MGSLRRFKYETELLTESYGKKILNPLYFEDIFNNLSINKKLIRWKSIKYDNCIKLDLLNKYFDNLYNLRIFVKYTNKEKLMIEWFEIDNNNFNLNYKKKEYITL